MEEIYSSNKGEKISNMMKLINGFRVDVQMEDLMDRFEEMMNET